MSAVHRRYLRELIRCIENVCASSNRLSTAERRDRVQDMLDAEPTREAIEAVKESSHEFGIMYAPIAAAASWRVSWARVSRILWAGRFCRLCLVPRRAYSAWIELLYACLCMHCSSTR